MPEGEKIINHVCQEVSECFPLAEWAELLLWNKLEMKQSQTSLTVEQIVQYKTKTFSIVGNSKHRNSIIISDYGVSWSTSVYIESCLDVYQINFDFYQYDLY